MPSLAQVLARPSAFSSAGERSSRLLGGDMPPQNPNFAVTGIAHLQGESICRAPQRARPFAPVTKYGDSSLNELADVEGMSRGPAYRPGGASTSRLPTWLAGLTT